MNTRDDEYANAPYIQDSDGFIENWPRLAQSFRDTTQFQLDIPYGPGERQVFDLFEPKGTSKGLMIFVHGGYWMRFDKSMWSHLATGGVSAGYTVAMPSYTLCPETSISKITLEVGQAITKIASMVEGPIYLSGHSAGGHLVSRMICRDTPLAPPVLDRIINVISISGVHDLRPLVETTEINSSLHLDMDEACAESPALLLPIPEIKGSFTCWVGADERPEFVRQNALLANVWTGYGIPTICVEEANRHHFDIIEGLMDTEHGLMKALLKR